MMVQPMEHAFAPQQALTDDAGFGLTPVRRRKVYELVAEQLKQMIERGGLKPGDQLPAERELMQMFNVGRPAIREALQELRNAGLVSSGNGRRTIVREPDLDTILTGISGAVNSLLRKRDSLRQLFDARAFMECSLARLAALHATKSDIERLKQALDENRAALGDQRRYEDTDIAFHRVLFTVPRNSVILATHMAFDHWLIERWRRLDRTPERDVESHEGHCRIVDAILMRDADAAEREMAKHLADAWKVWDAKLTE
jgi:DNA-binding FadR family transcriptional regulator